MRELWISRMMSDRFTRIALLVSAAEEYLRRWIGRSIDRAFLVEITLTRSRLYLESAAQQISTVYFQPKIWAIIMAFWLWTCRQLLEVLAAFRWYTLVLLRSRTILEEYKVSFHSLDREGQVEGFIQQEEQCTKFSSQTPLTSLSQTSKMRSSDQPWSKESLSTHLRHYPGSKWRRLRVTWTVRGCKEARRLQCHSRPYKMMRRFSISRIDAQDQPSGTSHPPLLSTPLQHLRMSGKFLQG